MSSFAMSPVSGLRNSGAGSNQYFNNNMRMPTPYDTLNWGGGSGDNPTDPGGGSNPGPIPPPGTLPGTYNSGTGKPGPTAQFTPWYSPSENVAGSGAPSDLGHGIEAVGLQYPGMSADFAAWLTSQMGQGLSAFGGQTQLPTGGMTNAGQLSAGMNPLLAQLSQFFQTGQGGGMPGMSNLADIANNGVSALPQWQAMIAAMGQNTAQNQANLQEQFAGMGSLAGSPFGTAMSNYMQQTNLDQNALLGQLTQSNIQNIQMPAINELFSGSQTMASGLQSMDQSAIDRMYQQFQLDQPQNNPLLGDMMGLSTLYPPTNKTPTAMENINSGMQGAGSLLQGIGSIENSGGNSGQLTF